MKKKTSPPMLGQMLEENHLFTAVIYKALRERMKPCLVLNKIDRLIVESRLSTTEAYHHLRRLIENVNA
eukprot:scaffold437_cov168-Ochromonas_danica.AAC.16